MGQQQQKAVTWAQKILMLHETKHFATITKFEPNFSNFGATEVIRQAKIFRDLKISKIV